MRESGTNILKDPSPARRRTTRQDRSASRQRQITEGAIVAISRHGVASLTHRRVAQEAQVSLAATTYYYRTKNDIIADASRGLLAHYVDAFHRFAERHADGADGISFREFALKLVFNAVGKHSDESLAWCEIILNTARQPELRDLSRAWFEALNNVWREIARLLKTRDMDHAATSAIDTVIGFLFLLVPLGLPESDLRVLLSGGTDNMAGKPFPGDHIGGTTPIRSGKKAEKTRQRILDAATEILIAEGAEALTFRRVSEKAGLTVAAPTYHFPSISDLWNAAQLRLFEEAKVRYRSVMGAVEYAALDVDQLVDVTTTIFLREATEFRSISLACCPLYIQAKRDPGMRSGLWAINAEQWRRWRQILAQTIPGSTPFDGWLMYALFTGKLIRILTTDAETQALSKVRREFAYDLRALAEGTHWSRA